MNVGADVCHGADDKGGEDNGDRDDHVEPLTTRCAAAADAVPGRRRAARALDAMSDSSPNVREITATTARRRRAVPGALQGADSAWMQKRIDELEGELRRAHQRNARIGARERLASKAAWDTTAGTSDGGAGGGISTVDDVVDDDDDDDDDDVFATWKPEQDAYAEDFLIKCSKRLVLEHEAAQYYRRRHYWLAVPALILGTIATGTAFSQWSNQILCEQASWVWLLVAFVFASATVMNALTDHLFNFKARAAKHHETYKGISRLIRELSQELSNPFDERRPYRKFMRKIVGDYNRYTADAELIPSKVAKLVNRMLEDAERKQYEFEQQRRQRRQEDRQRQQQQQQQPPPPPSPPLSPQRHRIDTAGVGSASLPPPPPWRTRNDADAKRRAPKNRHYPQAILSPTSPGGSWCSQYNTSSNTSSAPAAGPTPPERTYVAGARVARRSVTNDDDDDDDDDNHHCSAAIRAGVDRSARGEYGDINRHGNVVNQPVWPPLGRVDSNGGNDGGGGGGGGGGSGDAFLSARTAATMATATTGAAASITTAQQRDSGDDCKASGRGADSRSRNNNVPSATTGADCGNSRTNDKRANNSTSSTSSSSSSSRNREFYDRVHLPAAAQIEIDMPSFDERSAGFVEYDAETSHDESLEAYLAERRRSVVELDALSGGGGGGVGVGVGGQRARSFPVSQSRQQQQRERRNSQEPYHRRSTLPILAMGHLLGKHGIYAEVCSPRYEQAPLAVNTSSLPPPPPPVDGGASATRSGPVEPPLRSAAASRWRFLRTVISERDTSSTTRRNANAGTAADDRPPTARAVRLRARREAEHLNDMHDDDDDDNNDVPTAPERLAERVAPTTTTTPRRALPRAGAVDANADAPTPEGVMDIGHSETDLSRAPLDGGATASAPVGRAALPMSKRKKARRKIRRRTAT